MSANQEWVRYQVSDALVASLKMEAKKTVLFVNIEEQVLVELLVKLEYECDKLVGKCLEDGRVVLNVLDSIDNLHVDIRLADSTSSGKLNIKERTKEGALLEVKYGRGQGDAILKYVINVSVRETRKYTLRVALFYEIEKKERMRIGDVIHLNFEAVRPIVINSLGIYPSVSYYVTSDPVRLSIVVSSNYEGHVEIVCKGAVKQNLYKLDITRETKELNIDTYIDKPVDNIEITLRIPSINYEETITKEVLVKDQKIVVKDVKISKSVIGKESSITIIMTNVSNISESLVRIDGDIYGFKLSSTEQLKPRETKTVELKTPVITREVAKNLVGEVVVTEESSRQVVKIPVMLPEPIPLQLKIEVNPDKLRIPSSTPQELFVGVQNNSDVYVSVSLSRASSTLSKVLSKDLSIEVPSYSYQQLNIALIPTGIGSETAELIFAVRVNDIVVDEYSIKVDLEVFRSFKVTGYTVVSPKNTKYVVKGQKVSIEMKVELLYDKVELTVSSSDLEIVNPKHEVYRTDSTINVIGNIIDYRDSMKIVVSDGLVVDVLEIPLKVSEPSIEYELQYAKIYSGVRKPLVLRLSNKFEVTLKVVVEFKHSNAIEFTSDKFETYLPPLAREWEVPIEVVGVDAGEHELGITLTCIYENEHKKTMDTWTHATVLKLVVHEPLDVKIVKYSEKLLLPYPIKSECRNILSYFRVDISLKNVSDATLSDVFVKLYSDVQGFKAGVEPRAVAIEPGRVEKVHAEVGIPAGYSNDILRINLRIEIGKYIVLRTSIDVKVERYNYCIIKVPRGSFIKDKCPHPRIIFDKEVYVFMPLLASDYRVCGEPLKSDSMRCEALKILYDAVREVLPSYGTPWETVASILYKRISQVSADFSNERRVLMDTKFDHGGIIVVPALLWMLSIAKLVGDYEFAVQLSKTLDEEKDLGILYVRDSALNISKNTLYGDLLRFVLTRDSDADKRLYERILNSVREGIVEPIFLLYAVNNGKKIPYDDRLAESLFNERKLDDYVLYVALSDASIARNTEILLKLRNITNKSLKVSEGSVLLALSLLLYKHILEISEEARCEA